MITWTARGNVIWLVEGQEGSIGKGWWEGRSWKRIGRVGRREWAPADQDPGPWFRPSLPQPTTGSGDPHQQPKGGVMGSSTDLRASTAIL